MNKISKKIVALVTMAAFVLTLVPMAAFAAGTESSMEIVSASSTYNKATVKITLSNEDATEISNGSGNVIVWVEDKDNNVLEVGNSSSGKAVTSSALSTTYAFGNSGNHNMFVWSSPSGTKNIDLTLANTGDYTIYVAKNTTANKAAENVSNAKANLIGSVDFHAYGVANTDQSAYGVMDNAGQVQSEATVAVDGKLTTEFRVKDIAGDATTATLSPVWIWATQGDKTVEIGKVTVNGSEIAANNKGYKLNSVENEEEAVLQFAAAGTYTIHAGVGSSLANAQKTENMLLGSTVVTVTEDTVVDYMTVEATVDNGTNTTVKVPLKFDETNTAVLDLTQEAPNFAYDGIDEIVLNGVAYESDKTFAKYQTINFATTKDTVVELKNTTDNTDSNGAFSVAFTMSDKSNAVITMTDAATGLEYAVRVIAAETTATNIDRTKTGGYVLAGNDSKYGEVTYKDAQTTPVKFTDAVQFAVTDEKGDAVTGVDLSDAKIDVRSAADDSTLTADDLALVWDEENSVYTLAYKGADYTTDLIPGKYEVRVALASGDNATVTFNVAKFGKVEDMVVDMYAKNNDNNQLKPTDPGYAITDEVTLGQTVTVTAKYVDANGIKVPVDENTLQYGFDGKAVREGTSTAANKFETAYDTPANESLLGTLIHVKVYNQANKQLVEKDLTVVDSYNTYSLEFDPAKGPINEDNDVTVKVVDKDGNVAKVTGTYVSAYVADQSDADAKVSVDTTNATVKNGKATISVYSDRETTADIVVVVKAGEAIYAGTLEYTFGTEDPLANRTVVMTIGSSDYVVNNKIVTGDAAPFVDSNWRTMVPLRALAESFDAEVNWDNDARTVTINYDANTQIVMTIGESTYTVNGEEKTMDTAPVIQGDRTYVPIRFAAQGMGFSVTPLYDSNNLTASVVFQK